MQCSVPNHRMEQVKLYSETHYKHTIYLDHLAEKLNLSQPHLSAEFIRYFDISPIHYLIHLRLNQACILMKDQN